MTFRHIYLESLYLYFIFICFCECKTEKSNGQHYHGRYTQGIEDFELLIPRKINQDGSFLSFTIPHYYQHRYKRGKRESVDDTVRYALDFAGKVHNIVMEPNDEFISPSLVIETHRGPDVFKDVHLRKLRDTQCHYTGFVHGDNQSRVALSVCDGLAGMIKTTFGNYFIEPAKYAEPEKDGQHLHVIYQNHPDSKTTSIRNDDSKRCDLKDDWNTQRTNQSLKYAPVKRSAKPKHRYLATLVVADKKFLAHHNGTDVETYILTIMNMVSDYFHDDSIGQLIDFVIVRMMLLEKEHKDIDIEVSHNSNKTLRSFCNWQKTVNPADPLHPNHHDVAVLLTRQDLCTTSAPPERGIFEKGTCSIQGLANSAAVCNVNKSCTINEDNGLVLSVVVTHELGHLLGCLHDQQSVNGCPSTAPDGSNYVMAANIRLHTTDWSTCSSGAVADFFDAGLGDCLLNVPADHNFLGGVEMLAGAMFDGTYQCRLAFGGGAEACGVQGDLFCTTLMCRLPGKRACYSRGDPAADGTPCGPRKWCYERKCVEVGRRPGAVDGGWGEWSGWAPCSRTCGGGVSFQERICDRPVPQERGRYCLGERKHYRTCNTSPCNATTTFRERQCAKFNSKTFNGKLHQWRPHRPRAAYDRCALLCINEAGRHKTLRARAHDGTSCRAGTRDLCIAGRCAEVGCDWRLESGAVVDRCGVCGGNGTRCRVVAGTFKNNASSGTDFRRAPDAPPVKTWLIMRVPRGARNIRVSLAKPAPRVTIAVASADRQRFFLNGGDVDNDDGQFRVGRALGVYSHPEPYRGEAVIAGPTPVALSLLLMSGGGGGVGAGRTHLATAAYSFAVPGGNASYRARFAWEFVGWDACPVRCGGGSRLAQARCVEAKAGEVSRSFCRATERPPPRTQACGREACPVRWVPGAWSACDSAGTQRRTLHCRRQASRVDLDDVELPDAACRAARPARVRQCKGAGKTRPRRGRSDDEAAPDDDDLSALGLLPEPHERRAAPAVSELFRGPVRRRPKTTACPPPTPRHGTWPLGGDELTRALQRCQRPAACSPTPTDHRSPAPTDHRSSAPTTCSPAKPQAGGEELGDEAENTPVKKVNKERITSEDKPKRKRDEEAEEEAEAEATPVKEEDKEAITSEDTLKTKRDEKAKEAEAEGTPPKKVEKETITSEDKPKELKEPKEIAGNVTATVAEENEAEQNETTSTKPTVLGRLKSLLPKKKVKEEKPAEEPAADAARSPPTNSAVTGVKVPRLKTLKRPLAPAPSPDVRPGACNVTRTELVVDRLAPEDADLIVVPVSAAKTAARGPAPGECGDGGTRKLSDEADAEMGDVIPEVQIDTRHKKVYHADEALKKIKELEAGRRKG